MVKTIGEAYEEAKELERKGLLRGRLEQLIETQERRLEMRHLGFPRLIVSMNGGRYKNWRIYVQYWDEELLSHELGHYYLDKLCNKLGVYFFNFDDGKKITEWWEARDDLISEGIAMYFEKEMNNGKDDFKDSEYPERIKDFLRNKANFLLRLQYSGGYHLVKPILDKFGVEEGCKRIISDLPKKREMVILPEYRERILSESVN